MFIYISIIIGSFKASYAIKTYVFCIHICIISYIIVPSVSCRHEQCANINFMMMLQLQWIRLRTIYLSCKFLCIVKLNKLNSVKHIHLFQNFNLSRYSYINWTNILLPFHKKSNTRNENSQTNFH